MFLTNGYTRCFLRFSLLDGHFCGINLTNTPPNFHFLTLFSNSVFTGDAFGVSYRPVLKQFRLENKAKPFRFLGMSFGALPDSMQDFLFPSSSPVDFEPKEAHLAIDKILATKAERAFVTHEIGCHADALWNPAILIDHAGADCEDQGR